MNRIIVCSLVIALLASRAIAGTPDTAFTYQGELRQGGIPVNGLLTFEFRIWDEQQGGTMLDSVELDDVPVTNGRFTVELDFDASVFDNTTQWLDIKVESTLLAGRQPITRAPYSVQTRGIYVDGDYNVGIGTTTPLNQLHVRSEQATLRLEDTTTPGGFTQIYDAQPTQLRINKNNANGQVLLDLSPKPTDGVSNASVRLFRETNTTGAKSLQLHRGNNTSELSALIAVDGGDSFIQAHGGNLGIGTTSPQWPLHVEGAGTVAIYAHTPTSGILGETSGLTTESRGVLGLASATTGDAIGVLGWTDSTGGIGVRGHAAAQGANFGVVGRSDSTAGTGVCGIAPSNSGTSYGVRGQSNSPAGYDFYAAGAGTDYGSSSSIRWKRNVELIDDPLDKLTALRGVYFDWDAEHGGHHAIGMIAEEVGQVLPEIVHYEENGIDANGMDYGKLTPLLVEAVKSLRAEKDSQIEQLRTDNRALQQTNQQLQDRMAALENAVARLSQRQEAR